VKIVAARVVGKSAKAPKRARRLVLAVFVNCILLRPAFPHVVLIASRDFVLCLGLHSSYVCMREKPMHYSYWAVLGERALSKQPVLRDIGNSMLSKRFFSEAIHALVPGNHGLRFAGDRYQQHERSHTGPKGRKCFPPDLDYAAARQSFVTECVCPTDL